MKNNFIKILRKAAFSLLISGLIYLIVLLFPSLLFAHKIEYKQCVVHSDRKIDNRIFEIIDSSLARIATSELYDAEQRFNLFICNDLWRLGLFSQGSVRAGGVAQYNFTRDIFLDPAISQTTK